MKNAHKLRRRYATGNGRTLRDAFQFFAAHAGGIVGENARIALDLARAELEAERRGWRAAWEEDDGGDVAAPDVPPDRCPWCYRFLGNEHADPVERWCEHAIVGCVLRDKRGETLGSLWGMSDRDLQAPYRRVVEAELASEALAEERALAQRDRDAERYMAL